jgi:hypothetical protein
LIEQQMVGRMLKRALWVAPVVVVALWLIGGSEYGISAIAGLALTVGNLWLSGRILGTVAENSPQLLMPAALMTFALGLALLFGVALGLNKLEFIYFPVTGFVLIGSHLLLVLWEATGAYEHASVDRTADVRS